MALGYDGTIRFDTSINSNDFNRGMQKIGNSVVNIFKSITNYFNKVSADAAKMAQGFDGIDAGMSSMFAIISEVAGVLGTIVGVIGTIVGIVVILVAIVAVAGIAIFAWAEKFTTTLQNYLSTSSEYYDQVTQLKTAFDNLKGSVMALGATLLAALAPTLMTVINWLIQAIQYVQMFIAALLGQKSVMQYVAGSATKAAGATGKAKKEAQGALAAFDQINVLQKKDDQEEPGGGAGSGGTGRFISVPIDPTIQNKVEKIREWFKTAWDDIKKFFAPIFNWINDNIIQPIWVKLEWLWNVIKNDLWEGGLKTVFTTIIVFLQKYFVTAFSAVFTLIGSVLKGLLNIAVAIITGIIQIFGGLIKVVVGIFTGNGEKIKEGIADILNGIITITVAVINNLFEILKSVVTFVASSVTYIRNLVITVATIIWTAIKAIWVGASTWFKNSVIDPIVNFFSTAIANIKTFFANLWTDIKNIWRVVSKWFTDTVITPIKNAFSTMLDDVKKKWETIFTGIQDFVKGVINKIIEFINSLLNGFTTGINDIINKLNSVGSKIPGWIPIPNVSAPQIPKLATGAVIPPNAEFLAILGDQKHGTNIEAPLNTIVQAVKEALSSMQTSGDGYISNVISIDGEVVYKSLKKVQQRHGISLLDGAGA